MTPGSCRNEWEAAAAARSGRWSPELRAHLKGCAACAEAAVVAEVLQQELQADLSMPSAGQVWWRAQVRARRADAERAVRPVWLVQTIASVFAVLSLVLLVVRFASPLQNWLSDLPAAAAGLDQPRAWIFLGTAAMFVAAVSAGLGYLRHSAK